MSDPAPDQTLLVSVDGPVATITLNRPEKLNALTLPMLSALDEALLAIDADPDVRVVVIKGAGAEGLLGGRRCRGLVQPRSARHVADLDAHGPTGPGAARDASPADDRRAQRDRLRRRTRACVWPAICGSPRTT